MAHIENLDILTIKEGLICHQVNCMGKMGYGLALDIRNKYPKAYDFYMRAYEKKLWKLGVVQLVTITDKLIIGNLAGQYYYGHDKRYTDYEALGNCLVKISYFVADNDYQLYIPYKMGCSSAGGDWDTVYQIIEQIVPSAIICRKE